MFQCLCLIFVIDEAEQLDYGSNQSDPIYAIVSAYLLHITFFQQFQDVSKIGAFKMLVKNKGEV